MVSKLGLYIARWQLSTPILFMVIFLLNWPAWIEVIIANLIGALVFFRVDKYIQGVLRELQNNSEEKIVELVKQNKS